MSENVTNPTPIPAPNPFRQLAIAISRRLYNHNPFYAISAVLTLIGAQQTLSEPESAEGVYSVAYNSVLLLSFLSAYCVLLALAAWLILRLGQVWEDIRTIVVTLSLLLVALSVSFDQLTLASPNRAVRLLGAGLLFSVVLWELLLRALRIRLSLWFRLPYHLMMANLFLYPVLLSYLLDQIGGASSKTGYEATLAGILFFPWLAALFLLTLLPAIWRGPALVKGNGTPWSWPWFPWSGFVVVVAASIFRSYFLTLSFHPRTRMDCAFGAYFLLPYGCALAILLFEMGKSVGRVSLQRMALFGSLGLLLVCSERSAPTHCYAEALALYREWIGAPASVALYALMALFVYGWIRGLRAECEWGFLVLSVYGSGLFARPVAWTAFWAPDGIWLALVAVAALLLIARKPDVSWRWFVCVTAGAGAWALRNPDVPLPPRWEIAGYLLGVLVMGVVFRDEFAQLLRRLSAAGMVSGAILLNEFFGGPVSASSNQRLLGLALICGLSWLACVAQRGSEFRRTRWITTGSLALQFLAPIFTAIGQMRNPKGMLLTGVGLLMFGLALAISLHKGKQRRSESPA